MSLFAKKPGAASAPLGAASSLGQPIAQSSGVLGKAVKGGLLGKGGAKERVAAKRVPPAAGFGLRRAKSAFLRVRADFYEDLAASLDDRAVLVNYLEKQMRRAQSGHSPLAGLYSLWLKRMDSQPFSSALKGTVPAMDSLILLAAESSGDLPQGLRFLSFSVRSIAKIRGTITGAIAMPAVVSGMIVGMLYGFGKFMVPILEVIVKTERWPTMGKIMLFLSNIVLHHGTVLFGSFAAVIGALIWALPNWSGPLRRKFDGILPFSVYRDYNSAVMLVSLSGLMESGSSLVASLKSMRSSGTPWLAWHLSQVLLRLDSKATTPAQAFDTGMMPKELYNRVLDYGERSSFQEALKKIGAQSLDKLDKSIQMKAKLVNNLLLFVSGTMMALVVGSVMLTAQQARVELSTKTTPGK